jgi:K+-sensing histidine kinase KdpD
MMQKLNFSNWLKILENYARSAGLVLALTLVMLLVGRDVLGEAVVAMLYLALIAWAAVRWGQWAGICAALIAFLTFNFFFIPPFYTFAVSGLEGWLILVIFLIVSIAVVGRIEASLSKAQASEREAIFMYELSAALAPVRTQEAVAHTLTSQLQQLFMASQVKVVLKQGEDALRVIVSEPGNEEESRRADIILPIWNASGLAGEIQVWHGYLDLPSEDSRLLRNFASQAGQALERTRLAESEEHIKPLTSTVRADQPTN